MKPGTPGFVGLRLRHGREARGMTAIALADLVGVSRAAISQYEGEAKSSPSPDVMRKISTALNLPIQWFLRPLPDRVRGTIFFRCMSSATKRARLQAERRYDWLRDVVEFLEHHVNRPSLNFPDMSFPADPAKISPEQIEEAATHVRRFWGMKDGPISNVTWLLENNGVVVARFDLHATTLDAFSEWEPNENRPYVILGKGRGSACRSRFDAAHELAHLVLHRHVPKAMYNHGDSFALIEEQAHRFAGAFLLPADTFSQEFASPSLDALLSLKQRWRVSVSGIAMRLSQLDLIDEQAEKRLWMNLGRRKWRTQEPLDDVFELEQPVFHRRCFELLIERGIISADEASFCLGLPTADIELISNLPAGYFDVAKRPIAIDGEPPQVERRATIPFPRFRK